MTTLSNGNSAVEIVSFQAYELQQFNDGNDMASEKRYLQVLIETKDANDEFITLSIEQLSGLEWVDAESGEVFPFYERVDSDPGENRTIDNAPQQNSMTFVFEGYYKRAIVLKARLELNGRLIETNEVALGSPGAAVNIQDTQWLPGTTTVSSDTPFTISLKKGTGYVDWSVGKLYKYGYPSISVFNLSLKSKKEIRSVTTIPRGDYLFHVGKSVDSTNVRDYCWWFHHFAPARPFDYGYLDGSVGGEAITFSYIRRFKTTLGAGESATGPEKFYFVTIDESHNRHETVLSVTNETYVFRNSTRSESQYYSGLIARKGSA